MCFKSWTIDFEKKNIRFKLKSYVGSRARRGFWWWRRCGQMWKYCVFSFLHVLIAKTCKHQIFFFRIRKFRKFPIFWGIARFQGSSILGAIAAQSSTENMSKSRSTTMAKSGVWWPKTMKNGGFSKKYFPVFRISKICFCQKFFNRMWKLFAKTHFRFLSILSDIFDKNLIF